MNITEKLYVCIKKQSASRSDKWLARQMKLKAAQLAEPLSELEDNGKIYRTETGDYRAINEKFVSPGKVVMTASGRAYVWLPDGRELPLEMPHKLAFAGEDVRVFLPKSEEPYALLIGVPEQFPSGEAYLELEAAVTDTDYPPMFRPGDEKDIRYLLSPLGNMRRLFRCEIRGVDEALENGAIVRVRIKERPRRGDILRARVVRLEADQPGLDMYKAALEERFGLDIEQTEPDESQMAALSSMHAQGLVDPTRRDLRELMCFTIDGETAKDFDDAVSLRHENGALLLGVHIADVSHFVRTNMPIDNEAYRRGTSVYLPWKTCHMLPQALSCELCSLMPDVDRLAITCEMTIENGNVTRYEIFQSVIHSNARLTYTAVNELIKTGGSASIPAQIQPVLKEMYQLSKTLGERRYGRGAINFESREIEFKLDENGVPVELLPRVQQEAESLIEEFMLLANQTVAAHMLKNNLGCVYRIHEKPSGEDVARLTDMVRNLGISWNSGKEPEPRAFQRLMELSQDNPARALIQTSTLRSMKKAKYSEKPMGHFGLALRDYCHFTSPIRRYPDLLVHRILHMSFTGKTSSGGYMKLMEELPGRAAACSANELNASTAEREADNLLKCAYMSGHEDECFEGAISGFNSWAIFVVLDNFCEGAIPLRTLYEYYTADAAMTRMISDSGKVLEIGMRVKIKVSDVSLAEPRVYFKLQDSVDVDG